MDPETLALHQKIYDRSVFYDKNGHLPKKKNSIKKNNHLIKKIFRRRTIYKLNTRTAKRT